jgi:serine/threonine protein kinase
MAYLSEAGEFAHLDLKPSNVLIDGASHAKIADFGLSQRVRARDGRYSSAPGGTWAYAAPEPGSTDGRSVIVSP